MTASEWKERLTDEEQEDAIIGSILVDLDRTEAHLALVSADRHELVEALGAFDRAYSKEILDDPLIQPELFPLLRRTIVLARATLRKEVSRAGD